MRNNAGISVISAVIIVVVVSFLGVAMAALFVSRSGSTTNRLASMQAQYIAEGGLQRGTYQYKNNCSGYTGETNVALGSGQFTVNVYSTSFDGVTKLSGQARIMSTGSAPNSTNPMAVKVAEEIATCPTSSLMAVASKGVIVTNSNPEVVCGTQTCSSTNIQNGTCTCAQQNSTVSYPAVTVPGGPPGAPTGGCNISGTVTWSAGTYYCEYGLTINNSSVVNLSGAVTIYVGSITLNTGAHLNWGGQATNLLVMVTGSVTSILDGSAEFKGYLYDPGGSVTMNSSATVYGAIVASYVTLNASDIVTWDQTAGSSAPGFASGTGSSDTHVYWETPSP